MKIYAKIVPTPPEGGWKFLVSCDELPNIHTCGETLDHAKQMAYEAISLCIDDMIDNGVKLPTFKDHEGEDNYYEIPLVPMDRDTLLKELMNIGRKFSEMIDNKFETERVSIEADHGKMTDDEFHIFIQKKINEISDEGFEALKVEVATANGDLGIALLKREEEINKQLNTQKH